MNETPAPRFTRQRIDAPHVITFCADMGALLLAARARQRNPERGAARETARDPTQRLNGDIAELRQAVKTYAETMQRIRSRILAPEIALSGEPQATFDQCRLALSFWQHRSERARTEQWRGRSDPAPIALAHCWDSLIAQVLDGLEAAAALCSGQENIRSAYEAAIHPATAAQVLRLHIEPPAEAGLQLVAALHRLTLAREQAQRDAEARQFESEWRALERRQRIEPPHCSGGLGWLVLLALIGLGS
jgi:hypothetical protein